MIPISIRDSLTIRAASWLCVAGLVAVLGFLAAFSVVTQEGVAARSRAADRANQLAAVYADARFWVGQEESLERKYRLEPTAAVQALHDQAETAVLHDFTQVAVLDGSAPTRRFLLSVRRAHRGYVSASRTMFRAVDANDAARVIRLDHELVDPVFGAVQKAVYARSNAASRTALGQSADLRHEEDTATHAISIAFGVGLLLVVTFGAMLLRLRRRLAGAWHREIATLGALATTDAITRLGNHRVFQEDLSRAVAELRESPAPLSLVLLDLDALKIINDTLGHQEGDEYITAVADAMRATAHAGGGAYRIGGDEFAVILKGVSASEARVLVERIRFALAAIDRPISVSVSAGIVETHEFRHPDALIREGDLALRAAKRGQQAVVIYSPALASEDLSSAGAGRAHRGTLANALALAVDAKDSYTRSHCQTVSKLCALVAAELGLDPDRVVRMRLAGLLHDVGKIGVPDAILNKPGPLDPSELAQMQRHATLGGDIVAAADLPEEAHWIRHHHERYDGAGYPDGLRGDAIPLESRIILTCDAYEAMTSNRPYRKAPGHAFAIAELERHAGTQFDARAVDALAAALASRHEPSQRELAEAA
jgi:diguanylate cyclase (GGDEF)-like protein/putative nucleotidyltransferase with HDIG domain